MSIWDKLRNCPFCGGEPSLTTLRKDDFTFVKIICKRCGATGPEFASSIMLDSVDDVAKDPTCILAADAWNGIAVLNKIAESAELSNRSKRERQ